jgi:hypothetical protein
MQASSVECIDWGKLIISDTKKGNLPCNKTLLKNITEVVTFIRELIHSDTDNQRDEINT